MSRALIVGSEGQDGRLLFRRLANEGVSVLGLGRSTVRGEAAGHIKPVAVDSSRDVREMLELLKPTEIYYLAAAHRSSQDRTTADRADDFDESIRVNLVGIARLLDSAREVVPEASVFYAASSLVFGSPSDSP